jgi:hypothetical protein
LSDRTFRAVYTRRARARRREKGTTCHYYGRCRLPNAYFYDKEIVPRVVRYIELDPRFANTTIWVLGQRRWVYLKGCVARADQAKDLEGEVGLIDDVEMVVNELMVGTVGKPLYRTQRPSTGAAHSRVSLRDDQPCPCGPAWGGTPLNQSSAPGAVGVVQPAVVERWSVERDIADAR